MEDQISDHASTNYKKSPARSPRESHQSDPVGVDRPWNPGPAGFEQHVIGFFDAGLE
jgi:hypothetical protein